MARFKLAAPFTVPIFLLIPTYTEEASVTKKTFPAATEGILINGNFKTYGGTERDVNGVYSVEDTATVETWFRPDIKADCRIALADDPTAIYEIINQPEDVELRHQYLRFRVRRVKGGA